MSLDLALGIARSGLAAVQRGLAQGAQNVANADTAGYTRKAVPQSSLAVGDQHFQKKCVERITAFKKNGCTILLCSHSPYHIRTLCDVALWLDGGQVKEFGPTEPVLGAYEMHTRLRNAPPEEAEAAEAPAKAVEGNAADAPAAGSAPPGFHHG